MLTMGIALILGIFAAFFWCKIISRIIALPKWLNFLLIILFFVGFSFLLNITVLAKTVDYYNWVEETIISIESFSGFFVEAPVYIEAGEYIVNIDGKSVKIPSTYVKISKNPKGELVIYSANGFENKSSWLWTIPFFWIKKYEIR